MPKGFFCTVKVDDLGAEVIGGDFEQAEGDGEVEAAGAGSIEVSDWVDEEPAAKADCSVCVDSVA